MILLSPNGDNEQVLDDTADTLLVGTLDGVFKFRRTPERGWTLTHRALEQCFISALTRLSDGSVIASMHGLGIAKSCDQGVTWDWIVEGLTQFDVWTVRAFTIKGRELLFAGTMPAHLFVSETQGSSWRELSAIRDVPSFTKWTFPPPPHLGHIKDIAVQGDRLFIGVEVGALVVSDDEGISFRELLLDPDPSQVDVHRVIIGAGRRERILVSTGLAGMMVSEDNGNTWGMATNIEGLQYPDPLVKHPKNANLIFVTGAVGWPPHWDEVGKAQGKIARSTDGGVTWNRLLGGLPDGQRALFCALSLVTSGSECYLYVGDTDGQIFESRNMGDAWSMIAETAPVSKGDFYRSLARKPSVIQNPLPEKFSGAAAERIAHSSL